MGLSSHHFTSPRFCFSTENYNEWMNKHYHKSDNDDEKIIPESFFLLYCDECEKNRECTNNLCTHHLSHGTVIACNFCQNNFKTFNDREVRFSAFCWSTKRKLNTYNLEELKKLANFHKMKKKEKTSV